MASGNEDDGENSDLGSSRESVASNVAESVCHGSLSVSKIIKLQKVVSNHCDAVFKIILTSRDSQKKGFRLI